jgi:hypothetical protein
VPQELRAWTACQLRHWAKVRAFRECRGPPLMARIWLCGPATTRNGGTSLVSPSQHSTHHTPVPAPLGRSLGPTHARYPRRGRCARGGGFTAPAQ